jgi:hypothetical protein
MKTKPRTLRCTTCDGVGCPRCNGNGLKPYHTPVARPKMTGPVSIFRGKTRAPVSITLTPEHHAKARAAMLRLGMTRADLIGLLIEKYADSVER